MDIVGAVTVYKNGVLDENNTENIQFLEIGGIKPDYYWNVTRFWFYGENSVKVMIRFDGELGEFIKERGGITLWYPPLK